MTDAVEQRARQLFTQYPTIMDIDGGGRRPVDWDSLVRNKPHFIEEYRSAARRLIAVEEMAAAEDAERKKL